MAIKYNNKYETERREEKTVDKLYDTMYNNGISTTKNDVGNYVKKTEPDTTKRFGFASEIDGWAKKNSEAIKYAGDGAINSIKKASKDYLNKYLKDAPEETDKDELFGSIAKWQLARDANDEKRGRVAMNNIIGNMSTENKEHYLKEQIPLSEYVKAKDDFDHKTGKYTTMEYASKAADEAVKKIQKKLNEKGYTDKYGNKLKEDGIAGSKTLQALDFLEKDLKNEDETKATDNKYNVDVSKIKKLGPGQYQYGDLLITNNETSLASADGPMTLEDMDMDTVVKAIQEHYEENPESDVQYAMRIDKKTGNYKPDFYHTSTGGKLSPGDEKLNKLKQTMIKGMSAGWYVNENDVEKRTCFENQTNKLREFDDNSFNRAIYLNNSSGAKDFGHNAVMLMNESGASVVFSFYSQKSELPYSLWNDAEMRFSVLTPEETNKVLYGSGEINKMVASDYDVQNENYDGFLYFEIDNSDGYNMYHEAVRLFDDPGFYSLLLRQCDSIADRIFRKGNIHIEQLRFPNGTYEWNKIRNRMKRALI